MSDVGEITIHASKGFFLSICEMSQQFALPRFSARLKFEYG